MSRSTSIGSSSLDTLRHTACISIACTLATLGSYMHVYVYIPLQVSWATNLYIAKVWRRSPSLPWVSSTTFRNPLQYPQELHTAFNLTVPQQFTYSFQSNSAAACQWHHVGWWPAATHSVPTTLAHTGVQNLSQTGKAILLGVQVWVSKDQEHNRWSRE